MATFVAGSNAKSWVTSPVNTSPNLGYRSRARAVTDGESSTKVTGTLSARKEAVSAKPENTTESALPFKSSGISKGGPPGLRSILEIQRVAPRFQGAHDLETVGHHVAVQLHSIAVGVR